MARKQVFKWPCAKCGLMKALFKGWTCRDCRGKMFKKNSNPNYAEDHNTQQT